MASIPSFMQSPKVEQAPTGAKASPVMWPIIEICAAGVFQMFHTTLGDTDCQGAVGSCHFSWRCRSWRCFSFITLTLPRSISPWTFRPSISASSRR
jgi:hypothetical protein